LLVEKGAKIDVPNKRGLTPLGVATTAQVRGAAGAFAPTLDERKSAAEMLRSLGGQQ
jgi:hypothetical protein